MSRGLCLTIGVASLASVLSLVSVHAGTAEDGAQRIEEMLSFAGNTETGVQSMRIEFDICTFRLDFSSIEDGIAFDGWMTGNLVGVEANRVTLQPNETDQDVRFEFGSRVPGWAVGAEVGPGHPLYQALFSNAPDFAHVQRECDAESCVFRFDLSGETENNNADIDLTGIVTREDAPILLNAFQDMATLCTATGGAG